MTTILYTKIGLLPQYVQDTIWSFNVEGHIEKTKKLIEEFNSENTMYCAGCLKKVHINDCFDTFSAEYFFYTNERCHGYGIECIDTQCRGMNRKRSEYIHYYRTGYYRNWRYRLDIYDEDDDDDDEEDDYYDY